MTGHVATLRFERRVAASVVTLWQVWSDPAARAVWAAPSPEVRVEIVSAQTGPGGHEVSLCKVAGQPDLRCDCRWLDLRVPSGAEGAQGRSVNSETVSANDTVLSTALVSADLSADPGAAGSSRIGVTVQLSTTRPEMESGYRQGFEAGLDNLAAVAARTMVLQRTISVPPARVWDAWSDAETLSRWWGPEGFTCRTRRIDLRPGGEWLFEMQGPDGRVYPNHHRYGTIQPQRRLHYTPLLGENGPKHADAWIAFDPTAEGGTQVTLGMIFTTQEACDTSRGFGAEALGQQTLTKLARVVGAA